MGKANDAHLARMNTLNIPWDEMTDAQKLEQRKAWDKIVSDPANLYCTCPRTSCRNNHNCAQCITLHRYYDCLTDCLTPFEEALNEGIPQECWYNTALKMQSDGNEDSGCIIENDPEQSRANLAKSMESGKLDILAVMDKWDKISKNPKNRACRCKNADCWYHGNCVKCIALHRYYKGVPACVRHVINTVEEAADQYRLAHPESLNA